MKSAEQLYYERRFEQEQRDTGRLTGPVYTHYQDLAPVMPARSSLENLPLLSRRGPDGKIIPRGPAEPAEAPVEHIEAAAAPDIETLAQSVEALSDRVAEIFEVLDEVCRRTGVPRG